jgi:hypothetical protein
MSCDDVQQMLTATTATSGCSLTVRHGSMHQRVAGHQVSKPLLCCVGCAGTLVTGRRRGTGVGPHRSVAQMHFRISNDAWSISLVQSPWFGIRLAGLQIAFSVPHR